VEVLHQDKVVEFIFKLCVTLDDVGMVQLVLNLKLLV